MRREFVVGHESSGADLFTLGVARDSLKYLLAGRDTESEGLRVTPDAQSDYVELLNDCLEKQNVSFEKTKATSETRLAELEPRPNAVLAEMTALRDGLLDEVDRLSSDWSVLSIDLTTRRPLSATSTEVETISAQFIEQKMLKMEAEQNVTDVEYELDGVKTEITQFGGRRSCLQESFHRILRRQDDGDPALKVFVSRYSKICN